MWWAWLSHFFNVVMFRILGLGRPQALTENQLEVYVSVNRSQVVQVIVDKKSSIADIKKDLANQLSKPCHQIRWDGQHFKKRAIKVSRFEFQNHLGWTWVAWHVGLGRLGYWSANCSACHQCWRWFDWTRGPIRTPTGASHSPRWWCWRHSRPNVDPIPLLCLLFRPLWLFATGQTSSSMPGLP